MPQWSDWKIGRLRELIGAGLSASEVGKQLGVSKNSVIGKAERIGLKLMRHHPPRPKPPKTRPVKPEAPPPKPRPPPRQHPPPDQLDALKDSFDGNDTGSFALFSVPSTGCLWPIGDPASGDFRYCGAKRQHPRPYCAEHAKIAYQPTKPQRRD
jgi:GcrA cell cycle regulator